MRQRIRDIPRHIVRDLDHRALRDYRRRTLHFQLDTSPPEMIRDRTQVGGAPGRRPTLADIVRDKLHGRVLEADIDRSALVDLGTSLSGGCRGRDRRRGELRSRGGGRVRLNSLHLVNFRQHADSRIVFDTGLTGIIGPNGSGKTTILEAIAWALYGNSAARGTRDSIRFNRAPSRATVRVELDFEMAGHRYRVVRGLTNAELYLDGASSPIANSITGVTELLQRRLGMTRAEFFNTYFTGQKELNVMAAMGPSERAKFLSRVLGYEKLRVAQDLVRERRKLITAETAGLRSGMPDLETIERIRAETGERLATAERASAAADRRANETAATLAAVVPEWERVQRERDQFQVLLTDLKVAEHDEDAMARDAARIARELADVAAARSELEPLRRQLQSYQTIVTELQTADALYREEGRRRTLLDSERVLADEIAYLRGRRDKVETAPALEEEVTVELETRRRELEESLGELEARRTEWVRDRQEADTKLQALRGAVHRCPAAARPPRRGR